MVSAIFSQLTSGAQSFVTFLTSLFQNVIDIFYTAGEQGAAGSLTDIGILFVTAVAVGFVYFGIRWITKLMKFRA